MLTLFPDNVTLHLDGVLYYRVVDPYKVTEHRINQLNLHNAITVYANHIHVYCLIDIVWC